MCVLFIRSYDDLTFRDDVKPLTKPSPKNLALLQPLDAPRGLTAELVARLTADITSGKLPPGSRLPTEQEMIAATGVSRTVIREAVATPRGAQRHGTPHRGRDRSRGPRCRTRFPGTRQKDHRQVQCHPGSDRQRRKRGR